MTTPEPGKTGASGRGLARAAGMISVATML